MYAIVQLELKPPSIESLKRAFRVLPDIVDQDAVSMGKDAFGILVDKLTLDKAKILQNALYREGIYTEAVPMAELIVPPHGKPLRKAQVMNDVFMAHDCLNRPVAHRWDTVIMICAGKVNMTDWKREETEFTVSRQGRYGEIPVTVTEVSHKEERNYHYLLSIILNESPAHYRIQADSFHFNNAAKNVHLDKTGCFTDLVIGVIDHAPDAVLNRGASLLTLNPETVLCYPSEHAFDEEITWQLWNSRR